MSTNNNHRLSPREAREQAAEATGFLASVSIWIGDEEYEIPQRGLMDEDQRDRLDEVELETESWDRMDDIVTAAGNTRPGPLKVPYRKNGKLIRPSYPVRVAVAVLGEERYKKYKAGGGRASDITATLAWLDQRMTQRQREDSKSLDGGGDVAAGADTDRG